MDKKNRVKLQRDLKLFTRTFHKTLRKYIEFYSKSKMIHSSAFPKMFSSKEFSVDCYYSEDREHILIIYSNENNPFTFELTKGNVFDVLDDTGLWKDMPVAMSFESSQINLSSIQVEGAKPFEVKGENIEILFDDLSLKLPNKTDLLIKYGIVLSKNRFDRICKDMLEYSQKVALAYKENILFSKRIRGISFYSYPSKTEHLEKIKSQMEYYFFNGSVKELEIDNFIYNNPIILEVALGLVKLKSQVILKDQAKLFNHDLKPDLIAYNLHEKVWTIVDYKRSKSEVLKRAGKVRESMRADVNDLISQLRDYKEYFSESLNRDYYKSTYHDYIEYPYAVGIIGRLDEDLISRFNRQSHDFPRWVNVRPYNYIYDSFCRFIEVVNSIN